MLRLAKTGTIVIISGWIIIFMVYNNLYSILPVTYGIPKLVKTNMLHNNSTNDDFLLSTEGCTIPNFSKRTHFKEAQNMHKSCGVRAVFVEKLEGNKIKFKVDDKELRKHLHGVTQYTCCYSFVSRSNVTGKQDTRIEYSSCRTFKNGDETDLLEETVKILCNKIDTKKTVIYTDTYLILKKKYKTEKTKNSSKMLWNVLIIGMDTMSRARAIHTLPHTIKYFKENNWLDFRAYQKVGLNTFPNLMALLTGKNSSAVYHDCAGGMDSCNEELIWSDYRSASYITAYGEDHLSLPDTFSRYKGFSVPPTDHYTRPFFLTGEQIAGNLVCANKRPSAHHLLDYAADFANAYKHENFFGLFWINSYSHNLAHMPSLIDKQIISIMENLKKSGVLDSTFILFNSDHGIRFGDFRLTVESYYTERLPMLFMWVPSAFRRKHSNTAELYNLETNQMRLITPYDVFLTLQQIIKFSEKPIKSEGCPTCLSLFQEINPNRTCALAGVDQKWCSCHSLEEVSINQPSAVRSIEAAVAGIRRKVAAAGAIDCFVCEDLHVKKVVRIHSYKDSNNLSSTYYVIAIIMSPGDVAFEATVKEEGNEFTVLEPTDTILSYNARGNCVINKNLRAYCVCKKIKCRKSG